MELLSQELKDATVISIGHRAELADFHHRKIILSCGRGGAILVSDVHPAHSASAQDSSAAKQRAAILRYVGCAGIRPRRWQTFCNPSAAA
jgi:hypothetical protein